MTFEERVAEARERVKGMDGVDGFKDRSPGTILAALESGLRHRNGCEFDAYVMLEDVRREVHDAVS